MRRKLHSPSMASKGYSTQSPSELWRIATEEVWLQSQEAQNAMRHQVEDMGTTLTKMHVLLKSICKPRTK